MHILNSIRFGAVGLYCRDCPVRCHVECRYLIRLSCVPRSGTPTSKGLVGYLCDYAPNLAPMIPALIVHCVNEIEARGLTEVGLYRVSAAEREYKSLKEQFLRGKATPYLANIDVHVLCGCIKDFLRSLREPLIPTCQLKDFRNAVQNPDEVLSDQQLREAIKAMPQPNRDTLSFLISHFQFVAHTPKLLMPVDNIVMVFGPTIVGNSSLEPDLHAVYKEVPTQCSVMARLLRLPGAYWKQNLQIKQTAPVNTSSAKPAERFKSKLSSSVHSTPSKIPTLKKLKLYAMPSFSRKK